MLSKKSRGEVLCVLAVDTRKYTPVKNSAAGGNVLMKLARTIAALSPPRVTGLVGSRHGGVDYLAQNRR